MICNYSYMPSLQRQYCHTTVEVMTWMRNGKLHPIVFKVYIHSSLDVSLTTSPNVVLYSALLFWNATPTGVYRYTRREANTGSSSMFVLRFSWVTAQGAVQVYYIYNELITYYSLMHLCIRTDGNHLQYKHNWLMFSNTKAAVTIVQSDVWWCFLLLV